MTSRYVEVYYNNWVDYDSEIVDLYDYFQKDKDISNDAIDDIAKSIAEEFAQNCEFQAEQDANDEGEEFDSDEYYFHINWSWHFCDEYGNIIE